MPPGFTNRTFSIEVTCLIGQQSPTSQSVKPQRTDYTTTAIRIASTFFKFFEKIFWRLWGASAARQCGAACAARPRGVRWARSVREVHCQSSRSILNHPGRLLKTIKSHRRLLEDIKLEGNHYDSQSSLNFARKMSENSKKVQRFSTSSAEIVELFQKHSEK